jgi:DNA-binding Xre family transcriptional regulator
VGETLFVAFSQQSQDEVTQIKGETVVILCQYFGCGVGDLLYVENDGQSQPG